MSNITQRHYSFGRYDRITIQGTHYRWVRREKESHILQLVSGNVVEPHFQPVTDLEFSEYEARKSLRVDVAYFSKAHAELLLRQDSSNLLALTEEQLRTIDWKYEWCRRYEAARADRNYAIPVNLSGPSLDQFIAFERDAMDRWYLRKYGERRPAGRLVVPSGPSPDAGAGDLKERKSFDYPSASSLRNWITRWKRKGYRREGLRAEYDKCGRRDQLEPIVERLVATGVEKYKDLGKPTGSDIYDGIEVDLRKEDKERPGAAPLTVSRTTIYNRIKKLNPFEVEVGRHGAETAARKYAMVGLGNGAREPLERVEMDDWECDLFVLASKSSVWKRLTKQQRNAVPRVRCTITIAIDCATRCVVGFNVSELAPSTPAVRAALSTIVRDKSRIAKFADCDEEWPMHGRPALLSTDGGPVFDNDEVNMTVGQLGIERELPEQDPRKRGTIEAFFRTLKRFCRFFAGQSFANVLERADYPSEQMASLAFEEFYKMIVRYIVDSYHNHHHRGLEHATPRMTWQRAIEKYDMRPTPTSAQQLVAFGFRTKGDVTLDKHGLLVGNVSYSSPALGTLMELTGTGSKHSVVVNPNDIGSILVHVEPRHRAAMTARAGMQMYEDFLEVPTPIEEFHGITLAERLAKSANVRAMARQDQALGKDTRIAANAALWEYGRTTMRELGLPDHQLTKSTFDRALAVVESLSGAGLKGAPRGDTDRPISEDGFGTHIASSQERRSRADNTPVERQAGSQQKAPRQIGPAGDASPNAPNVDPEFFRSANMEGEDE